MPKRPAKSDPHPSALKTPSKGKKGAPDSRIRYAGQVWEICDDLADQDKKRRKKRSRIFKAYHRFPPSEYSTLFELGMDWQSNCNFGMMAYVVDNNLSSFFDMVTQRTRAADILTKKGKASEKAEWSDHISNAFDRFLREWDEYLINVEQDLLDMLLFSKGIQMWETKEGCTTEHVMADDFLVPDGTKVSFSNFDVIAIKRSYKITELWEKVKDQKSSKDTGWNRDAVIEAMLWSRKEWREKYKKDSEEWIQDVADGNVTISSHIKEYVHCYMLFIKQFNGKIGKYIVLQDYRDGFSLTREKSEVPKTKDSDGIRKFIDDHGFLFTDENYEDDIRKIFAVFMDCAGSVMWHRVPSLAEKIFVQCRQYDFTMNAIMDAVRVNMSLMLQASTAEASEKIKELVWGPYTIIPSDIPFVQQRLQLPTGEATSALQFMMLDMFRGIGEYRINEQSKSGTPQTATQRQLDAAEAAKLSGTQLQRFNGQCTLYYRQLYKKLTSLVEGEKDYEHLERFKDYLTERGVPKSAWQHDNIESIQSNMLTGAGSPSYKLMAAEKTIGILNVSPKGEGQANAIKDALAALHGRSNVDRYVKETKPDKSFNDRIAGYENQLLSDFFVDPADVQVNPEDDDLKHLDTHYRAMIQTITLVNEKIKDGSINEQIASCASYRLLNIGAHCTAHNEKLKRDESKKEALKASVKQLGSIEKMAAQLAKTLGALKEQQKSQGGFDPTKDPEIARKIALDQLEIDKTTKLNEIKLAGTAASHKQRLEHDKERHALEIAGALAKQNTEAAKPETTPDE